MTPRGRRVAFRATGAPSLSLCRSVISFKSHVPRDYHLRPFITLSFVSNITLPLQPKPNSFSSEKTKNMSRATVVELDFFGMEKENSSKSQFQKFLDRQRSFRGMQSAISKINPQVLKSVIASGSVNHGCESGNPIPSKISVSVPSSPALPVYTPPTLRLIPESLSDTAPLTIFYNGTVSVFDAPRDKAENILKLALERTFDSMKLSVPSSDQQQLLDTLNGDLPIARRKSLQRFLEKRKERLTSVSPYACCT